MSVNRTQFRNELQAGVDLSEPDLQRNLQGSGVSLDQVRAADLDGDGIISGRQELDQLFRVVDRVDDNRQANSFANAASLQAFDALKGARRDLGADIVRAASDRVTSDGTNYAFARAPTSPLPGLSGNTQPGVTQPAWLQNQNKCNQFVGDALTQAGVQAPTVTMANGSLHYSSAERWPSRTDLFDRVTDPADIRPGDVIVIDYPSTGESTAHIEVVTGTSPLRTTGAHHNGAYEMNNTALDNTTPNAGNRSFTQPGGNEVYILRPKKGAE